MKKLKNKILTFFLIFTLFVAIQQSKDLPLKTNRITDKILLVSAMTGNSTMVGIDSPDGLVVIDAMWSPAIAEKSRRIIEKEFGKSQIRYYINSNPDILAIGGNTVFKDSISIAHFDCKEAIKKRNKNLKEYLTDRASEFQERVDRTENKMKEIDPESEKYKSSKQWSDLCKQITTDFTEGFEIKIPEITFSDKMIIAIGDLTLELIYFGNASSAGDIIAFIPEEGFLFTGDLFHYHHVLPLFYSLKPDINRWTDVAEYLSLNKKNITHIARSNGNRCWNWSDLESRFKLLHDIIRKVEEADNKNLQLNELLSQLTDVEIEFPYVKEWDTYQEIGNAVIRSDVKRISTSLWKENHKSAFKEIKLQYEEAGIEKAIQIFNQLKDLNENEYYFAENELNNYGYVLLKMKKVSIAIEFFKMNIVLFPKSANVYDSLGEAYMRSGDRKKAIQNYKKSLELNPNNTNAAKMLQRLLIN